MEEWSYGDYIVSNIISKCIYLPKNKSYNSSDCQKKYISVRFYIYNL